MGTWDSGILDNDGAMDVYGFFENLYNKQELDIEVIKQKTLSEFGLMNDENQVVFGNEEWLAYAQICWECKALDTSTIGVVEDILNDKADIIEEWEDLAEERISEIEKFLVKIQEPVKRKKRIKKEYVVNVPYEIGDCILTKYEDGKYGVTILLDIDKNKDTQNMWTYFLGTTRIYSQNKPTIEDIKNSHFLVINYGKTWEGENAAWIKRPSLLIRGCFIGGIKNNKEKEKVEDTLMKHEVIANLEFKSLPEIAKSFGSFGLDSSYQLKSQLGWEQENQGYIDLTYPLQNYLQTKEIPTKTSKKSWQFWK